MALDIQGLRMDMRLVSRAAALQELTRIFPDVPVASLAQRECEQSAVEATGCVKLSNRTRAGSTTNSGSHDPPQGVFYCLTHDKR